MKGGKKVFFDLTMLELTYVDVTIDMNLSWLKFAPDALSRFKIGLNRGWKIVNFESSSQLEDYEYEIVELLCDEACWKNHSPQQIQISSSSLIAKLIRSGHSEPLKFIMWTCIGYVSDWVKEYRPWSKNILKQKIPFLMRRLLSPGSVRDWVDEYRAIKAYKTDPSPRIFVVYSGGNASVAWYSDFLKGSWVFCIDDIDRVHEKNIGFFMEYIGFMVKHNCLYTLLYACERAITPGLRKKVIRLAACRKYDREDLEREINADPKRYELWKKHFGEVHY